MVLIERMKLSRKYAVKVTLQSLEASKFATEEVLDQKKFKTWIQGLQETRAQDKKDEKDEKDLVSKMASMQVEKK